MPTIKAELIFIIAIIFYVVISYISHKYNNNEEEE